jgi:hypothetical protein
MRPPPTMTTSETNRRDHAKLYASYQITSTRFVCLIALSAVTSGSSNCAAVAKMNRSNGSARSASGTHCFEQCRNAPGRSAFPAGASKRSKHGSRQQLARLLLFGVVSDAFTNTKAQFRVTGKGHHDGRIAQCGPCAAIGTAPCWLVTRPSLYALAGSARDTSSVA